MFKCNVAVRQNNKSVTQQKSFFKVMRAENNSGAMVFPELQKPRLQLFPSNYI
jgi:hypothetical protein